MYSLAVKNRATQFIKDYGKGIAQAIRGTGLFFPAIVAQKALESGWGTSGLTKEANNFGGIKYNPNIHEAFVVSDTSEVVKGKKVRVPNVKFAKFTDPTEGIKKHFQVLMADRYKNARLNAKSPEEQIKMLVQAGYSTMNPTAYVNLMKGNISRVRKLLPFGRIA